MIWWALTPLLGTVFDKSNFKGWSSSLESFSTVATADSNATFITKWNSVRGFNCWNSRSAQTEAVGILVWLTVYRFSIVLTEFITFEMDATGMDEIKLIGWNSSTTPMLLQRSQISQPTLLDLNFRDLSYTTGKGKNLIDLNILSV